jgi:hypothetical protein
MQVFYGNGDLNEIKKYKRKYNKYLNIVFGTLVGGIILLPNPYISNETCKKYSIKYYLDYIKSNL